MKLHHKAFVLICAFIVFTALAGVFLIGKRIDSGNGSNTSGGGSVAGVSTIEGETYIERLAKDLAAKGAVFYGSDQGSDTKAQKEMFKDAFSYIDYVECDQAVQNSNSDECISQQIEVYPTWIYQEKQYKGIQELGDLAKMVGFSD